MNCNEINQLNPIELLSKFGIKYNNKNGEEYKYHSPFRKDETPSLSINAAKKVWIDFGTRMKGKNVDLLMNLYKTSSVSNMLVQFNKQFTAQSFSFSELKKKSVVNVQSKSISENIKVVSLRSYALIRYLKKRGISEKAWSQFVSEIEYQIKGKTIYGIAFKNDSKGYEVRNERMKFCLGKKDITTLTGEANQVVIFEGFMDFLSYIEMKLHQGQTIIVLNSTINTSRLEFALKQFPDANIEAYLDNDSAGIKAFQKLQELYPSIVNKAFIYKNLKDLNELLMSQMKQNKGLSIKL